jgi:UDP-N-acetylmuramyl tripeptide synthase
MEFLDARRLTGPSLLFEQPGAILDVSCSDDEAGRLAPAWEKHARRMLALLGLNEAHEFRSLRLLGGVSLGFTAPIDALYAAVAVSEYAFAAACAELDGTEPADFDTALAGIRETLAGETNPALLALAAAARQHGVTLLWDDEQVSLGLGRHARTWAARELPDPGSLDWAQFADIPVAIVTGTNGKTTTVRLAAHIVRVAGNSVGFSSTDYIAINERIVDRDDWAGPGGARTVLRDRAVDIAILETARGGLLRRGLGIESADAALITNIGRDHLGDFGSRDQQELLRCKWIVSRAVRESGTLILNADDPLLVSHSHDYEGRLAWFALAAENETVQAHCAAGGAAFVLHGEQLTMLDRGRVETICHYDDVPITLAGAARHNIANALAAAALSWCLGVSLDDIRNGLGSMSQDANPGRGNIHRIGEVTVIVDFAHNPQALRALLSTANRLPAARKALCFGQAGDRPDDLIRELARCAWDAGIDRVYVSELAKYYRGRGAGEVFAVIRDELLRCGASPDQLEHHDQEIDSLESALAWARPGDLIIMLALERSQVLYDKLRELARDA